VTVLSFLTFAAATNVHGQNKRSYEFYMREGSSGLCSKSLSLFKDSSYCIEGGCENHSSFSFGKWTQKNNTITFQPEQRETYKIISRVETSSGNDSKLTVIIYDNKGNNISSRVIAGQFKKNVGFYKMELDSTDTRYTDIRRQNTTITLKTLERLFKQRVEVITDSSNIYKIYLNIPGDWNFHYNSIWDNSPAFSVIKSKNKLTTVLPNGIEGDENSEKTTYIKQEE